MCVVIIFFFFTSKELAVCSVITKAISSGAYLHPSFLWSVVYYVFNKSIITHSCNMLLPSCGSLFYYFVQAYGFNSACMSSFFIWSLRVHPLTLLSQNFISTGCILCRLLLVNVQVSLLYVSTGIAITL